MREREAGIDQLLAPIKDMYALLVRYEVRCLLQALHLIFTLLPSMYAGSPQWSLLRWERAGARGQGGTGLGQRPAVRLEEAAQVRIGRV